MTKLKKKMCIECKRLVYDMYISYIGLVCYRCYRKYRRENSVLKKNILQEARKEYYNKNKERFSEYQKKFYRSERYKEWWEEYSKRPEVREKRNARQRLRYATMREKQKQDSLILT